MPVMVLWYGGAIYSLIYTPCGTLRVGLNSAMTSQSASSAVDPLPPLIVVEHNAPPSIVNERVEPPPPTSNILVLAVIACGVSVLTCTIAYMLFVVPYWGETFGGYAPAVVLNFAGGVIIFVAIAIILHTDVAYPRMRLVVRIFIHLLIAMMFCAPIALSVVIVMRAIGVGCA